jgi:hypothetical protein
MAPSPRVGTLRTLGLAVYKNSDGNLWYRNEGVREKVNGNMLWTSLDGREMRGKNPHNGSAAEGDWESDLDEEEERDLELAIARSMEAESDSDVPSVAEARSRSPSPERQQQPDAAAEAGPSPAAAAGPRTCVVCMDNEPDQLLRPCNHVVLCRRCVQRVRRCPICRRNIRSVVTVFL